MIKKVKEWLEIRKAKNKVGRPKLVTKDTLKAVKIELSLAFVFCAILLLFGTSIITSKSPLELLGINSKEEFAGAATNNNEILVLIAPSTTTTTLPYGTVVEIKTTFVNTSGTYYRKWFTYTIINGKDINNYGLSDGTLHQEAKCEKVVNLSVTKSLLTLSASNRYGKWIIYSDSECKTQVLEKRTLTYTYKNNTITTIKANTTTITTTKGSSTTIKGNSTTTKVTTTTKLPIDINIVSDPRATTLPYNTVIELNTAFYNNTNNTYYRKWFTYTIENGKDINNYGLKTGTLKQEAKCTKINKGLSSVSPTITLSKPNRYGKWVIYSDSLCTKVLGERKSLVYTYSEKPVSTKVNTTTSKTTTTKQKTTITTIKPTTSAKLPIDISIISDPLATTLPYNTVIELNTAFYNNSSNIYYRKWFTYKVENGIESNVYGLKTGTLKKEADCIKINKGISSASPTLTLSKPNRYGKWVVYSDSLCTKVIGEKRTLIYTYPAKTTVKNK